MTRTRATRFSLPQPEGLIKICGLREPEHAAAAAEAGADLLGFIFVKARRQVTPKQARNCIDAARRAAPHRDILAAGVFVDADPVVINDAARIAGLDLVQLHGNEPPGSIASIAVPVMKVFRPGPGDPGAEIMDAIETYLRLDQPPVGFVIDGYSERGHGGEGVRADWTLAASVNRVHPLLLGGGLDPENVAAAIAAVKPLGVDVSSGVETDGVKDPARIASFILAAREAFRSIQTVPA
ncbi:MAG: phosphoribosylanthranilate isomerase [Thermomicrobiales bacterium]